MNLDFPAAEPTAKHIENDRSINVRGGFVTEHKMSKRMIVSDTFVATIFVKTPIQCLRFELQGQKCVLEMLTHKDCQYFVTHAILSRDKGALYLRWNRKQKPGKSLVVASYWAE